MPNIVINQLLEDELTKGNTLHIAYPKDMNYGHFWGSSRHIISFEAIVCRSPRDFMVLFHPNVIEIHWHKDEPIPAGTLLNVQLEEVGGTTHVNPELGYAISNVMRSEMYLIDLGSPNAPNSAFYIEPRIIDHPEMLVPMHAGDSVARNIEIHCDGDASGCQFRIYGTDPYKRPMCEYIDGVSYDTAIGKKAFHCVDAIIATAACAGRVSIGTGHYIGFPIFIPGSGFIFRYMVDGKGIIGAELIPGYMNKPTATCDDLRGTFRPPEDIELNGKRNLQVLVSLFNIDHIGHQDFFENPEQAFEQITSGVPISEDAPSETPAEPEPAAQETHIPVAPPMPEAPAHETPIAPAPPTDDPVFADSHDDDVWNQPLQQTEPAPPADMPVDIPSPPAPPVMDAPESPAPPPAMDPMAPLPPSAIPPASPAPEPLADNVPPAESPISDNAAAMAAAMAPGLDKSRSNLDELSDKAKEAKDKVKGLFSKISKQKPADDLPPAPPSVPEPQADDSFSPFSTPASRLPEAPAAPMPEPEVPSAPPPIPEMPTIEAPTPEPLTPLSMDPMAPLPPSAIPPDHAPVPEAVERDSDRSDGGNVMPEAVERDSDRSDGGSLTPVPPVPPAPEPPAPPPLSERPAPPQPETPPEPTYIVPEEQQAASIPEAPTPPPPTPPMEIHDETDDDDAGYFAESHDGNVWNEPVPEASPRSTQAREETNEYADNRNDGGHFVPETTPEPPATPMSEAPPPPPAPQEAAPAPIPLAPVAPPPIEEPPASPPVPPEIPAAPMPEASPPVPPVPEAPPAPTNAELPQGMMDTTDQPSYFEYIDDKNDSGDGTSDSSVPPPAPPADSVGGFGAKPANAAPGGFGTIPPPPSPLKDEN